jgi:WD40 repeat protein
MPLACISALSIALDCECRPQSMAFSPDGDWLAVGSSLGDVLVYSTLENKLPRLHLCIDNDAFNAVAISSVEWKGFPWLAGSKIQQEFGPDSGIVAAFEDGHVRIVECRIRNALHRLC